MSFASVTSTFVEYTVDGKMHRAYVAWNSQQEGPRPAVVIFPEWWGVNDYVKMRARELANSGYVAFVADMYGEGKVTTDAKEANAQASAYYMDFPKFEPAVRAAYAEMLKQPNVDSSRTAAIGFCFGGTCALELARSGADIKGCVSFHGGLGTPSPEKAANIKCRVLALRGEDDPFDDAEYVEQFKNSMDSAGVSYKMVAYPGAVHAFTNPNAGKAGIEGVAYNEAAEKASMEEMRALFREIFTSATDKK